MFQNLSEQNKRSVLATSLVLVAANLLPLIAVLKLNWSFYDLLVLYWAEIILVGVINVPRMILINRQDASLGFHLLKIAYVPFFAGHFGLFCVGIGLGLQVLFGKENFEVESQIIEMLIGKSRMLLWPLVISHILSFSWNYVAQREFRRTTVLRRMVAPYLRTIPVLAISVGAAFGCLHFGSPWWALAGFVAGKTLIDLIVHLVLHFQLMNRKEKRPIITVQD